MYKINNQSGKSLDYAGGLGVPCNWKSPIRRGEGLEAAYTVRNQAEHNNEVSSSGAGVAFQIRLEDRIEGFVAGIGPGPEGSSLTVDLTTLGGWRCRGTVRIPCSRICMSTPGVSCTYLFQNPKWCVLHFSFSGSRMTYPALRFYVDFEYCRFVGVILAKSTYIS